MALDTCYTVITWPIEPAIEIKNLILGASWGRYVLFFSKTPQLLEANGFET